MPHGGATRTPAFLASEFCRGCHQFDASGLALNGKLLENTYAEWKASRFSREGVQCQDCHMPDRRHLWRGIHDPDMVRSGLTITADAGAALYRLGETATVTLRITSTGIGHAFPTYVTPRVVLAIDVVDALGVVVAGSRVEAVIGREVSLDLSRELSDTRLYPGQGTSLVYRGRIDRPGLRARASVTVYPDAFYTRFFEALIAQGAGQGEAEIRRALDQTRRSAFRVFEKELPLSPVQSERRSPGQAQNNRSTSGSLNRSPCRNGALGSGESCATQTMVADFLMSRREGASSLVGRNASSMDEPGGRRSGRTTDAPSMLTSAATPAE